jgi:hypothetical protein
MKTIMMSALAAVGFLAFVGTPAMAQDAGKKNDDCCANKTEPCCGKADENCTWSLTLEGKRTVRKYHCNEDAKAKMPNTVRIEVKPEDRQAGDIEGMKIVGKRTERVFFRDVERKTETANVDCSGTKDACNYTFVTVGKRTQRRSFCEHNNQQVLCGDKAGECNTCRK